MNCENATSTKGMTHAEWLAARRGGLGGSDVAAVLGISPWRTPFDVWWEKKGDPAGFAEDEEASESLRIGTDFEDYVARRYVEMTGRGVRRHNVMLRDGILLGNIDRLVIPDGAKVAAHKGEIRTDRLLECKTTSAYGWEDGVPAHYQTQVNQYMGLTGGRVTTADVAVLFLCGRKRVEIHSIAFDRALYEETAEFCRDWWARYITGDDIPECLTEEDCRLRWRVSNSRSVVASAELAAVVADLKDQKAARKDLDTRIKTAELAVIKAMGDADTLLDSTGRRLATFRSNKDSVRTDWEAVARALNAGEELINSFTTVRPGIRPLRLA